MLDSLNAFGPEPKYLLLNKDEVIASFHVDGLTDNIVIDKEYQNLSDVI